LNHEGHEGHEGRESRGASRRLQSKKPSLRVLRAFVVKLELYETC